MTSLPNSTNATNSSDDRPFSTLRDFSVLTICSLITIFTILGNGLVLVSVKFRLRARSYSDYFIVSLCLADFFVGLFVMPLMTLHSVRRKWPFNYELCYVWMSIDFTCSTASFLTLASMALDRYWALTAPYFHLRNRSQSSVLIFVVSSWFIPFTIWPGSVYLGYLYNEKEPSCLHPAPPIFIVMLCIFFYHIPLSFMLICYSRIIVNIKNIEVLIRGTWDAIKRDSPTADANCSLRSSSSIIENDRVRRRGVSSSRSSRFFSLRSIFEKYFRSNRTETKVKINSTVVRKSPVKAESIRLGTTATFTGKKRQNESNIESSRENKRKLSNNDDETLIRARLGTRTSSLPAARCVTYFYCNNSKMNPQTNGVRQTIVEENQKDFPTRNVRLNSSRETRIRSYSHSMVPVGINDPLSQIDVPARSLSIEHTINDENRRFNTNLVQPSHLSTSFNSSRYSQRAIAQFMHERHKARLRRNQKASRMLGILLAVFLICWLPFIIFYPIMVFFPTTYSNIGESIVFWFGYANSLLNPFLYVYSSRNFRHAIVETLCCYFRSRSRRNLRYQWSIRGNHHR